MSDEIMETKITKSDEKETSGINVIISIDKEGLSQAIENGIKNTMTDLKGTVKKQTELFAFSALGVVAMLALIALFLSSYKF